MKSLFQFSVKCFFDEVTETMQILEAQGIEKVQDMDEVMQIDESLTIQIGRAHV